ncbi:MAG: LLM class flavin-dependent oxidoreductase, partial [Mycobacterium sp.]
ALYIGGMGARNRNFYHNLATRYGFGEVANRIQELYLDGRKAEAVDAVPDELVRSVSLIGSRGFVAERVAAFAEAGVTTLLVNPVTANPGEHVRFVEELRGLLAA